MTPYMIFPETPLPPYGPTDPPELYCGYLNQQRFGFFVPNSNPPRYTRDYLIASGTSFAAPVAAGAALIASRIYSSTPGEAKPALLKAMLTATARSLRGGKNYSVDGYAGTAPVTIGAAPDDVQGFGRIDITDIVDSSIAKAYINQNQLLEASGQRWVRTYAVANSLKPVKIALAWSDVATPFPLPNPLTSLLVNDLDLEVHVGNGGTCKAYYGNNIDVRTGSERGEESILYDCNGSIDMKNNVEKALFNPSIDGVDRFTLIVKGTRIGGRATPCPSEPCSDLPNQDFALYVQNAAQLAQLPAPTLTSAVGAATSATLTWAGVQGAAKYQIWRGTGGGSRQLITPAPVSALTYMDSGLAPGFYNYAVRALNEAGEAASIDSNVDYAWVGSFTDDPLLVGETAVKASHVLELRSRINELRVIAGLSSFTYTNPVSVGSVIYVSDITDLRTALDTARSALALSALTYANTLAPGVSKIRVIDIREIRDGLR